MKIKVIGEPNEKIQVLIQLYINGMTVTDIAKKKKMPRDTVYRQINRFIIYDNTERHTPAQKHLGSKQEPYWTEDELINGYVPPKVEDLEAEEREIYKVLSGLTVKKTIRS